MAIQCHSGSFIVSENPARSYKLECKKFYISIARECNSFSIQIVHLLPRRRHLTVAVVSRFCQVMFIHILAYEIPAETTICIKQQHDETSYTLDNSCYRETEPLNTIGRNLVT